MTSDQDANRLRILCQWMALTTGVMAAAFMAVAATMWSHSDWAGIIAREQWSGGANGELTLTLWARLAAGAVSCAHLGLLCWALWTARGLFLNFARGETLETHTGRDLRMIGGLVAAYGLSTPLTGALITLAVTLGNPPGQRMLGVSIGTTELILGVLGALILVLGHVMAEAARIADDNRQIV